MTQVPPGWYPDPAAEHEQRYWDGTQWTGDVLDAGPPAEDAPPTGPPPSTGGRRVPLPLVILIVAVTALVAGGIGYVVTAPARDDATGACAKVVETAARLYDAEMDFQSSREGSAAEERALDAEFRYFNRLETYLTDCGIAKPKASGGPGRAS